MPHARAIAPRPHSFRIDNVVIDQYAAEMGAIGVAIYAVLQRYVDRTTGQCWPSVSTMAATLNLSTRCVQTYLCHLARLGLIDIATRRSADGDHTSNLYTVHDPTQPEALRRHRWGGALGAGGGASNAPPSQENRYVVHHPPALDADEQSPDEQCLTSVPPPKTAAQPCDNQAHEHWSPVPGLRMCLDCFQSWRRYRLRPSQPPSTRRAASGRSAHGMSPLAALGA